MIDFEWNPEKAASNELKHGVSFAEAATAFGDSLSLTIFDPEHSETEDRFMLLGFLWMAKKAKKRLRVKRLSAA